MDFPRTNPEIRLATTGLVLRGLLHVLTLKGVLTPADVAAIERFALDLARDMRDLDASLPQVAGARLDEDVRAFFSVLPLHDGPEEDWPDEG